MCGILAQELRLYVIRPTLKRLELWSESAENLLLATCAHESNMGRYLTQQSGQALGIFQIEPATHLDVWQHYLSYRPTLAKKINLLRSDQEDQSIKESELITNLAYATAIARLIYLRVPAALPAADNLAQQADYWKRYYNTSLGKGDTDNFIRNVREILL